eukprot:759451-Hanusia_phi.AAC.10
MKEQEQEQEQGTDNRGKGRSRSSKKIAEDRCRIQEEQRERHLALLIILHLLQPVVRGQFLLVDRLQDPAGDLERGKTPRLLLLFRLRAVSLDIPLGQDLLEQGNVLGVLQGAGSGGQEEEGQHHLCSKFLSETFELCRHLVVSEGLEDLDLSVPQLLSLPLLQRLLLRAVLLVLVVLALLGGQQHLDFTRALHFPTCDRAQQDVAWLSSCDLVGRSCEKDADSLPLHQALLRQLLPVGDGGAVGREGLAGRLLGQGDVEAEDEALEAVEQGLAVTVPAAHELGVRVEDHPELGIQGRVVEDLEHAGAGGDFHHLLLRLLEAIGKLHLVDLPAVGQQVSLRRPDVDGRLVRAEELAEVRELGGEGDRLAPQRSRQQEPDRLCGPDRQYLRGDFDAMEDDIDVHLDLSEARPPLAEAHLERDPAPHAHPLRHVGEGLQPEVLVELRRVAGGHWGGGEHLEAVEDQHMVPLQLLGLDRELCPGGTSGDREEVAVDGTGQEALSREGKREAARRDGNGLDDRHWEAEDWSQGGTVRVETEDLAEVSADSKGGGLDSDLEALARRVQHHEGGHLTPGGGRLERDVDLERHFLPVVALLVELGAGKQVGGEDPRDFRELPEVQTPGVIPRRYHHVHRHVERNRLLLMGREVLESLVHLQQPGPEGPGLDPLHLARRVLDDPPDAGRRPRPRAREQRREDQREASAAVGGGHGRPVHQLLPLQRPSRHRRDRSSWSTDGHAEMPVGGGAARRPGVVGGGEALAQGVLDLHHPRGHERSDANERG